MTRGLRNRNPGNIRLSSVRYKGEVEKSTDTAFKQFRGMEWGYRAMFVTLNTYFKRHGLNTIREMISRWAPPVENHTDTYINTVGRRAMMDVDTPVDTTQREAMVPLVAAMSFVENGVAAHWATVERGWDLFEAELDSRATL